jgi:hypothetical protein
MPNDENQVYGNDDKSSFDPKEFLYHIFGEFEMTTRQKTQFFNLSAIDNSKKDINNPFKVIKIPK